MKKVTSITVIAIMAIFLIIDGCKKDDKVLNIITLSGNSDINLNNDYIPESAYYYAPYLSNCITTLYRSEIWVNFTSGASLMVRFYQPTSSTTIPLGKFNLAADCTQGFTASFYSSGVRKSVGVCITSGTISVTQSADIYDVDVDLTISPDCGGGTIKGNFNGPLGPGIN